MRVSESGVSGFHVESLAGVRGKKLKERRCCEEPAGRMYIK